MAEVETPAVIEPESLVPALRGGGFLQRWLEQGEGTTALDRIDTLVQMLERLRAASIKATYPTDWLIHTSRDHDGNLLRQVGYLQDCGCERAGKPWGISVDQPAIEREDFPDGTYSYHMIASARSAVTGEELEYVEGSRWSGDGFFQRGGDKIDPTDVRKSTYANLHGRAVRALSGLNGVPVEMLRQAGLDVAKVINIEYGRGTKGGESAGAATGTDAVVPYGNAKGTKITDLTDADLGWYLKTSTENVADPAKAKHKKSNERLLAALQAETARRKDSNAQAAMGGSAAPPPDLALRRTKQFKRLAHLCPEGWSVGEVLEVCTGQTELGKISETELAMLEQTTDAALTAKLTEAGKE